MHLLSIFVAALAPTTIINCLPIHGNNEQNNATTCNSTIVSHVRIRRDVLLTNRDIEEAGRHNVDLNKSNFFGIKTLHRKHADGGDYSIWVHNSFDPDIKGHEESANDMTALGKRSWEDADANDRMPNSLKKKTNNPWPFAHGAGAFIEWTYKNKGGWRIGVQDAYYSTNILIGGSNTGANMRFSVRKEQGRVVILGTKDVGDTVGGAYHKLKKTFKCLARMAGKGQMKCRNGDGDYKNMLHWEIDRSDWDIVTEAESQEQLIPELTSLEKQHQEPQSQGPQHRPIYLPFPVIPAAPITITVPAAPRPVIEHRYLTSS